MKTPICDFVKEYGRSGLVRAHMPGHKGVGDMEHLDITEISGADSLYDANGIIKESEKNASALFGADTLYGTEGSSQCIKAMLYLACICGEKRGEKPLILAARNVHRAFISAAALIDFDVTWLYAQDNKGYISCEITPKAVERGIKENNPTAVYITSPDYLGNIQDIKGIGAVCKKYNVPLLVDNAHGAYLKFLPQGSAHPMDMGATMCTDSAHKTLPVLTGGAYLHINKSATCVFKENAKDAMALFGSTSPSYLILQSLDKANVYIETHKIRLGGFLPKIKALKERLTQIGFTLIGDEPLKITVDAKKFGYSGEELAARLLKGGVMCEFADNDYTVLMLTQENSGDIELILKVFEGIEKRPEICENPPLPSLAERVMDIKTATFNQSETIPAEKSEGRVIADCSVGCPPAVPILVSGEIINKSAIEFFKYYGIKKIKVIKE